MVCSFVGLVNVFDLDIIVFGGGFFNIDELY